jgi:hypothetical protein
MREASDRLQERHDARVTKPESRYPLTRFHGRGLEPVKGILGQDALMSHALDFERLTWK